MKYSNYDEGQEHAYRRGFDQGMYVVMKLIKNGKSIEDIQNIKHKVHCWRYDAKSVISGMRIEPPVEF